MKNNRCVPHVGRDDPQQRSGSRCDPPVIRGVRGDPPWMLTSRGDPSLFNWKWDHPPEVENRLNCSFENELVVSIISCSKGPHGRGMSTNEQFNNGQLSMRKQLNIEYLKIEH